MFKCDTSIDIQYFQTKNANCSKTDELPDRFGTKLVMLVGTKLQHVVSSLALEVLEQRGGIQIKPRDDLFWFGKPVILLRLIQFIIFQVQYASNFPYN